MFDLNRLRMQLGAYMRFMSLLDIALVIGVAAMILLVSQMSADPNQTPQPCDALRCTNGQFPSY